MYLEERSLDYILFRDQNQGIQKQLCDGKLLGSILHIQLFGPTQAFLRGCVQRSV